jgi:hypothetical protein
MSACTSVPGILMDVVLNFLIFYLTRSCRTEIEGVARAARTLETATTMYMCMLNKGIRLPYSIYAQILHLCGSAVSRVGQSSTRI